MIVSSIPGACTLSTGSDEFIKSCMHLNTLMFATDYDIIWHNNGEYRTELSLNIGNTRVCLYSVGKAVIHVI